MKQTIIPNQRILTIINRSSGELEWIVPILYWLAKNGFQVSLLFLKQKEYLYYLNSPFLKIIAKEGNMQLLCMDGWWKKYSFPKSFLISISFMFGSIIEKIKNLLYKSENRDISNLYQFKSFFQYENIQNTYQVLFFDNSFYNDLGKGKRLYSLLVDKITADKIIIYQHAPTFIEVLKKHSDDKPANKDTTYWRKHSRLAEKSTIITDDLNKTNNYSKSRGLESQYVGCPRFQDWWVKVLSGVSAKKNKKQKVLILSKLQGKLFKAIPTVPPLGLLEDIITCCEKLDLDWQLKVHPRDNILKIKSIVNKFSHKQFDKVVCTGSVFDLQNKFDLCVSIPNSAMLDTVSANIATIEFFDYSQKNIAGQIEQSLLAKLGIVKSCYDKSELMRLMKQGLSIKTQNQEWATAQRKAFNKLYETKINAGELVGKIINNVEI